MSKELSPEDRQKLNLLIHSACITGHRLHSGLFLDALKGHFKDDPMGFEHVLEVNDIFTGLVNVASEMSDLGFASHRARRIVEKLDELGETLAHFFGGEAKDYTD